MKEAKLYEVQSVRGDVVFALFDEQTKWVWTERSESAARQVGREKGYQVIDGGRISHVDMLRMIGHEPPKAPAPAAAKSSAEAKPAEPSPAMQSPSLSPPSASSPPSVLPGVMEIPTDGALKVSAHVPTPVYYWDDQATQATSRLKPTLPDVADVSAIGPLANVFQSAQSLTQPVSPEKFAKPGDAGAVGSGQR